MRIPRPALVGYAILVAVMLLGLWRVEQVAQRSERAARIHAAQVCDAYDRLHGIVRSLVDRSADESELVAPDELSPELRELLRRSREQQERYRRDALELLAESECPVTIQPTAPGLNINPVPTTTGTEPETEQPTEDPTDTPADPTGGTAPDPPPPPPPSFPSVQLVAASRPTEPAPAPAADPTEKPRGQDRAAIARESTGPPPHAEAKGQVRDDRGRPDVASRKSRRPH